MRLNANAVVVAILLSNEGMIRFFLMLCSSIVVDEINKLLNKAEDGCIEFLYLTSLAILAA